MPTADVDVSPRLVRALLQAQHPDLAELPVVELANGWDNVIYRLGDELTVRMPRRRAAAELVQYEQRYLPGLADRLPIAIPAPVRVGHPTPEYPWWWSVNPWFSGDVAARAELSDPSASAALLGEFLAALHTPAPEDRPTNPFRGHHVGLNAPTFRERVEGIGSMLDELVDGGADRVVEHWERLIDVREYTGDPVWLHADLHTANMLVADGEISAVIDFGDICAGDPANDYAVAWMLFGEADREVFRAAAGAQGVDINDDMWSRGMAWALHFGVMYLAFSGDNPLMHSIGERLITELFA